MVEKKRVSEETAGRKQRFDREFFISEGSKLRSIGEAMRKVAAEMEANGHDAIGVDGIKEYNAAVARIKKFLGKALGEAG